MLIGWLSDESVGLCRLLTLVALGQAVLLVESMKWLMGGVLLGVAIVLLLKLAKNS